MAYLNGGMAADEIGAGLRYQVGAGVDGDGRGVFRVIDTLDGFDEVTEEYARHADAIVAARRLNVVDLETRDQPCGHTPERPPVEG